MASFRLPSGVFRHRLPTHPHGPSKCLFPRERTDSVTVRASGGVSVGQRLKHRCKTDIKRRRVFGSYRRIVNWLC